MREEILCALRQSKDYVSGQELCEKLQVSRTAVWKQIRLLQEEGYEIEAVKNRGYRIIASPDTISAQEVLSRLKTEWVGRSVQYYRSVDSTNQIVKKMAEEGAMEGLLVVADEQTRGKGRAGRTWQAPAGKDIAMSLLLRPKMSPEKVSMITLVTGLAVAQACKSLYGLTMSIKWPNDVVIQGKKICGILTELSMEMTAVNYVVVGIGINVNTTVFPEELKEKATSLSLSLNRELSRAPLIASVMSFFEEDYHIFRQDADLRGLKDLYEDFLVNKGKQVRVLDPAGEFTGIAEGIDEEGQLLVQTETDGLKKIYAGEVSVRGVYGYV